MAHGNERQWTAAELRKMQAMRANGATMPELKKEFNAGDGAILRGLTEKPTKGRKKGQRKTYSQVSVRCPTCLVWDGHLPYCSGN